MGFKLRVFGCLLMLSGFGSAYTGAFRMGAHTNLNYRQQQLDDVQNGIVPAVRERKEVYLGLDEYLLGGGLGLIASGLVLVMHKSVPVVRVRKERIDSRTNSSYNLRNRRSRFEREY